MNGEEDKFARQLRTELGKSVLGALEDPLVTDVFLNDDGRLWQQKIGEGMRCIGEMSAVDADMVLRTVATILKTVATYDSPIIEGELPFNGERFAGTIFPTSKRPTFAIRKHASKIYTLDDYVKSELLSPAAKVYLSNAVGERKNILIIGGTNAGKTTFANAILAEIARLTPQHRVHVIEDTRELQCTGQQVTSHRAVERADMQRLLRLALRFAPDRIVVGEVRGAEALTLVKAWNTGHPGGTTTIHSNSVRSGLLRLEQLVSEGSVAPMQQAIAEAIQVIVSLQRDEKTGRREVRDVLEVRGYERGEYVTEKIF